MKMMPILAILLAGCAAASDQAALELFTRAIEASKSEAAPPCEFVGNSPWCLPVRAPYR